MVEVFVFAPHRVLASPEGHTCFGECVHKNVHVQFCHLTVLVKYCVVLVVTGFLKLFP